MYVAVHHSVDEPDVFWETVGEAIARLPDEFRLNHCLPRENGAGAVCIWEAPSVDFVRTLIEDTVGEVSTNRNLEVESSTCAEEVRELAAVSGIDSSRPCTDRARGLLTEPAGH